MRFKKCHLCGEILPENEVRAGVCDDCSYQLAVESTDRYDYEILMNDYRCENENSKQTYVSKTN